MKIYTLAINLCILLLCSACGTDSDNQTARRAGTDEKAEMPEKLATDQDTPDESVLNGTVWQFRTFSVPDFEHDFRGEEVLELSFRNGVLRSAGPCNGFSANYTVPEENTLVLTKFSKGQRSCTGQKGALERRFMAFAAQINGYALNGATSLTLTSDEGRLVLTKK